MIKKSAIKQQLSNAIIINLDFLFHNVDSYSLSTGHDCLAKMIGTVWSLVSESDTLVAHKVVNPLH